MPDRRDSSPRDRIVDRYWDAVLAGRPIPPLTADPELATTVQRVHALDAATSAPSRFCVHDSGRISCPRPRMSPPLQPRDRSSLHLRPSPCPRRMAVIARPQSLSRTRRDRADHCLLAGSAFAALYPLRHRESEGLPLFAPLGHPRESSPSQGLCCWTSRSPTSPDFPTKGDGGHGLPAWRRFGRVGRQGEPGSLLRRHWAIDDAGRGGGRSGTRDPSARGGTLELTSAGGGREATLAIGTAVVLPEKAVVALRNEGAVPARMLDLLWATESYSTESGGRNVGRATRQAATGSHFPGVDRPAADPAGAKQTISRSGLGGYLPSRRDARSRRKL